MIDQITELKNKTSELETKIQVLTEKQKNEESQTNCLSFSRNFSNLDIILPKKILVARIEPNQNLNILFQCQLDLTLASEESVEISLIVNEFKIYKTYKVLPVGSNQVSIMQNFKPLTDKKFSLYVQISPVTQKSILLNNISLFAWGNLKGNYSIDYQAINIGDKYLLSMLDNNCIYALKTNKELAEFNIADFDYVGTAISHSLIYDSINNTTYLFRVDLNGNLLYSNLDTKNEIFLTNNVSYVSADISLTGKILVAIVKENECYYFEIDENKNVSIIRKLYVNSVTVARVLCYFNKFRNKFMIALSNPNDSNYLVEQINETISNSDTVNVEYEFTISSITEVEE